MANPPHHTSDPADLELSLAPLETGLDLTLRYRRPGDAGEDLRGPFPVALDRERLTALSGDAVAYGAALTNQLLHHPVARSEFISICDGSIEAAETLRLRLHLHDPALHTIRWELLHDPATGAPLALDERILLTRFVSATRHGRVTLRPDSQLRAHIAVAAPSNLGEYNLTPIDAPAEIARIRAALDNITVDSLGGADQPCTLSALSGHLRADAGYDIVYLVAHGAVVDGVPRLYLANAAGRVAVKDARQLVTLLRNLAKRRPRLVVLASCASAGDGTAATLTTLGPLIAQAGVPAVLAMQGQVSVATVAQFMPVFFRELLHHGCADRALAAARLEVCERPDWWMPVLFTRLREGRIWAAEPAAAPEERVRPVPPELDPQQAIHNYLARLQRELAQTDVVPIKNAYAAADTRAYVPLQVGGGGAVEPIFAALNAQQTGLVLLGAAGSGKSHTLRYAALALAQNWPAIAPEISADFGLTLQEPLLPIYVQLQDLPRCRDVLHPQAQGQEPTLLHMQEPTLLHMIDYHIGCIASDDAPLPATLIRELTNDATQRCLFLLDGLDEIDEGRERQMVQQALLALQHEQPQHIYVVTSRPLPDLRLNAPSFITRQIEPLNSNQMRRILHHLYRAAYGAAPLAPEVDQQVERQAADLLATILADPDLGPMAPNPLFLSAMARMALSDVGLPRIPVKKYTALVDLLLEWRRNRLRLKDRASLFADVPHRAALGHLAEIAACMLAVGRTELTLEAFVQGVCVAVLPPRDPEDALDADALEHLLRSVVRHTGLLAEQHGLYRFTFGFRDYLAACAIVGFADMNGRLFAQSADPAWRTTIMLAIGYQITVKLNPRTLKPLFGQLLTSGSDSVILAAEALAAALDGREPDLEPERRQIVAQLHAMHADPGLIQRLEPLG